MTADTLSRPEWSSSRDGSAEPPPSRPSLSRLTLVEMRKMIDTRAGFWLLLLIAVASLAVVVIQLIWGGDDFGTFADYFELSLLPVGLLLPVLGILTVTTEWSQRTALTTFTLTPERHRVVIAKVVAASIFGAASLITSLLVSAIGAGLGVALDHGVHGWDMPIATLGQALLFQILSVVMGVGFGMLLMSTPTAIVLYFALPTIWQILTNTIDAIKGAAEWLDLNGAMTPLTQGDISGDGWGKLLTSVLIWIVLPLALGTTRLIRSEVK